MLWQILLTHSLKALSGIFLIRWSVLINFKWNDVMSSYFEITDTKTKLSSRQTDAVVFDLQKITLKYLCGPSFPVWCLHWTLQRYLLPLHRPWFIIILVCYPGPCCRHSAWNKLTFSHLSSDWPPFVQKRLEQLVTGLLPQASLTKSHTFCSPVFVTTLRRGSSRVQHVAQGCFDM